MRTRVYKGIKTDSGEPVAGRRGEGLLRADHAGMLGAGVGVIIAWDLILTILPVVIGIAIPAYCYVKLTNYLLEKLNG